MNEQLQENPFDLPAQYRITVMGILNNRWVERHWGLTSSRIEVSDGPVQTVLVGEVTDQAALAGILAALYNMQHTVVSVERLSPDADFLRTDTEEQA